MGLKINGIIKELINYIIVITYYTAVIKEYY